MKIYKIWQEVNNGYDTFDSAIVYAENEDKARRIHPHKGWYTYDEDGDEFYIRNGGCKEKSYSWCSLKDVKVEYIGENPDVKEEGLILASFNAG